MAEIVLEDPVVDIVVGRSADSVLEFFEPAALTQVGPASAIQAVTHWNRPLSWVKQSEPHRRRHRRGYSRRSSTVQLDRTGLLSDRQSMLLPLQAVALSASDQCLFKGKAVQDFLGNFEPIMVLTIQVQTNILWEWDYLTVN
ncbi:hypothetical protein GWG54_18130 [Natronococcus sp. JC468]|uniref:hypothetical protein n=1 Tax=Natronococcus sp. JC468 TaxID=1961921 RepID=UPI00143ACA08|nr:hypothetical protein [Natronococcus sp. JC468]NKE37687.1 hypothetical protein [Natronococcus sp. JC468]